MTWIPVEPVPMMPTRRPRKSTFSCGHAPVKYVSPLNVSSPLYGGIFPVLRRPAAEMKNRACTLQCSFVPLSCVPIVQTQIPAVGDVLEVVLDLRQGRAPLAPAPLLVEFLGEGIRVGIAWAVT